MIGAHTGLVWPSIYNRPRGGGSGYVAKGVQLNSSAHTHLFRSSLIASNSPYLLFSVWLKFQNIDGDPSFFASRIFPDPAPNIAAGITGFYNHGDVGFRVFGNAVAEGNGLVVNVDISSDPGIFTAGVLHHIAGSVDTGHGPGGKLLSLFLDSYSVGRHIKSIGFSSDSYDAFDIGFNGAPFGLPYQDDGYQFDAVSEATSDVILADFQLWSPASYVDLTDPTKLSKLISDGRPVDPAIAAAAFGTPLICFTGNASTFGTNQGSGGAFTLTSGTITDVDDAVELGDGAYVPPQPPANDDFANAISISLGETLTGSNVNASAQAGEPDHAFSTPAHSVWWKFVAPSNADVYVSLEGSTFDTVLGVYTGASVDALTEIASNDDEIGSQSALTFTPVNGTTYYLAVDGYGVATGSITIAVSAA